jgi:hypothetical protein
MTLTESDLAKIRLLVSEAQRARERIDREVVKAREKGATWTEIGYALGMTAQGAQKRYAPDGRERHEALKEEQAAKALRRRARKAAAAAKKPDTPTSTDPWPDGTVQETIAPQDT